MSTGKRYDVDLTLKAFTKAYSDRGEPDYVLFHSDQGSEYTAFTFRQTLENVMPFSPFQRKAIPTIMHVAKVSSAI